MNQTVFMRGLKALQADDYRAAERDFQYVINHVEEEGEHYNSVASYLGLVQVLNNNRSGLVMCRDAASSEVLDGQVFLNLAAAEWHLKNRKRAIDALYRGSKIDHDHQQLKRAVQLVDGRKTAVFGFLPRSHPVNNFFGRLLRRTQDDSGELSVRNLLY